jgi:FADH2 O2-dependent halogenase
MTGPRRYDVVVLGSGLGGSLLAAILSRRGMSVALIDRSRHPRFAIGESATPAAGLILHDLATRHGLPEVQPLARFGAWRNAYPNLLCGCKRGFSFFWHALDGGFEATSDHRHELLVTANASRNVADTQWYRPDVDRFLALLAAKCSATLFEGTDVVAIEHPRSHDWSISVEREGIREQLDTAFVVDATGPSGILMRQLGIRDQTSRLQTNSSALYGHWRDVRRMDDWLADRGVLTNDYPFPCDDSAVHHLFRDGWMWQLRFEDGLTSLGYVFADGVPENAPQISDDQLWKSLIQDRPVLTEILRQASQPEFPGRLFRTDRLQRLYECGAGEDWAALPFTIGFIDPLHSTGIAHSLCGVERLSRMLQTTPSSQRASALHDYSARVIDELLLVDRLVAGCYAGLCDFQVFSAWSMLYFAAATTFEKYRMADPDRDIGFLCAGDRRFVRLVDDLYNLLQQLCGNRTRPGNTEISEFVECVRERIEPYNHVGLFAPEIPNMYSHTAARKPPADNTGS